MEGLEHIPGHKVGYTLDWVPIHHWAQAHTLIHYKQCVCLLNCALNLKTRKPGGNPCTQTQRQDLNVMCKGTVLTTAPCESTFGMCSISHNSINEVMQWCQMKRSGAQSVSGSSYFFFSVGLRSELGPFKIFLSNPLKAWLHSWMLCCVQCFVILEQV